MAHFRPFTPSPNIKTCMFRFTYYHFQVSRTTLEPETGVWEVLLPMRKGQIVNCPSISLNYVQFQKNFGVFHLRSFVTLGQTISFQI